jgi:hypothetical protein
LDEFSINNKLIVPAELVPYDYECDSWAAVHWSRHDQPVLVF